MRINFRKLFKIFQQKTGAVSTNYVPSSKNKDIYMKYVDLLDQLQNYNIDGQQLFSILLSIPAIQKEVQKIQYGHAFDPYRLLTWIQTAINILIRNLNNTIQEEHSTRLVHVEQQLEYEQLTTLALTEDHKAARQQLEKTFQDSYMAKAKNMKKEIITEGIDAENEILTAQNELHSSKIQSEENATELAQKKSEGFKTKAQAEKKEYYNRKSNESPELTQSNMGELQKGIDGIKGINNGVAPGEFQFMSPTNKSENK